MVSRLIKIIIIFLIKLYQFIISPLNPSSCRHIPSCSQFTIEAIEKHGVFKGGWLAVKRIGHCHPLGTSGYDPVPDPLTKDS